MVAEIVGDVIRKHELDGNDSVDHDHRRWELHLKPYFGGYRASQVTSTLIDKYSEARLKQEIIRLAVTSKICAKHRLKLQDESAPCTCIRREVHTGKFPHKSTVNRELALLRAAFWYGYEATPPKSCEGAPFFNVR